MVLYEIFTPINCLLDALRLGHIHIKMAWRSLQLLRPRSLRQFDLDTDGDSHLRKLTSTDTDTYPYLKEYGGISRFTSAKVVLYARVIILPGAS